jgi:hypothetical protein
MKIHIDNLIKSLKEIEWDYDFKITEHKDGSAHLEIPDFIMKDIKYATESGFETPYNQVTASGFIQRSFL